MADFSGERTEEATPRRRTEARKKGTVTKSVELTNSLVIVCLLMAMPMVLSNLGRAMMLGVNRGLGNFPTTANPSDIASYSWNILQPAVIGLAPIVAIAMVVGVGVNFAQVGFVISGEAMNPSLSKINPFEGFKRLFSVKSSVEGLKAAIKTSLFAYLAYGVIKSEWPRLLNLTWTPTSGSLMVIGEVLHAIFLRVGIAWLILAAADYLFQRKQVEKQLKMTKEELKQEFRQNEQSPEMKGAMASRRRRLLKGRVAQAVKTADAIITNPTHFSIAIKYDPKQMHAPQVVAKGADHLAFRIRELAKESRIPIVPNAPLARQLYKKCEVGDFVPRELFQAVAEVLAYVYATLKRVRSG